MSKSISTITVRFINHRRSGVISILLVSCLIVGLGLQGCQQTSDPPEAEEQESPQEEAMEVQEEVAEEEENQSSEPESEQTLTPDPAWCDHAEDFYAELEDLGEFTSEEIRVEVCIPGGEGDYTLDTEIPDLEAYPPPVSEPEPFPIAVLIAYLKVLDSEDNPVYTFEPYLIMRVIYSQEAWFAAIERQGEENLDRPRVAYLEWEVPDEGETDWVLPWIEFSSEISDFVAPDDEDPESFGHLDIIIEELPDPLIGDC